MSRFNNHGKAVWGAQRPDSFPNGSSHRRNLNFRDNRRDGERVIRQTQDDGEMEDRTFDDHHPDGQLGSKLDRLIERLDKFDAWKEETDRRLLNSDPVLSRETEPPLGFDDPDDWEYGDFLRKKAGDMGFRIRNPNFSIRKGPPEERGHRETRGRGGGVWDPPGMRPTRNQFGGFDQ